MTTFAIYQCELITFQSLAVINVWSLEKNKNKTKARRNSQQVFCGNGNAVPGSGTADNSNTNANIIQATNQKFGTNGKITTKPGGLGHEGKYTPKSDNFNVQVQAIKSKFRNALADSSIPRQFLTAINQQPLTILSMTI